MSTSHDEGPASSPAAPSHRAPQGAAPGRLPGGDGPASSGETATERLTTALRLSLAYRRAGRTDAAAFLTEHADLAELLAPMIDASSPAVDDDPAGARNEAAPAPPTLGVYRLEREIGRGGSGVVYEAVQTTLGRRVAVKVMAGGMVPERMQRRFVREAAILGRLDHDHIVRVLDAGVVEGGAYVALELIDGASLAAVLEAVRRAGLTAATGATVAAALAGALPDPVAPAAGAPDATLAVTLRDRSYVDAVVALLVQIADALAYAHACGVVHRDVKPSNVLVRRDGRAVLSDFGVARDQELGDLSQSNPLAGTPATMAPEQVNGGPVDRRTDVYGLGATLYEALTLVPAFRGGTASVLARIRDEDPSDPRRLNPRLPRDVVAVLGKAMAKAPAERYDDATALARDLRAFLAREPVAARPPGLAKRLRRFARRRPWRAAALAAVALAALLGLLVAASFSVRLAAESRRKYQALAEVERLGMSVALDAAIAAAAAFDPPAAAQLPAMTAWLEGQARSLVEALPGLRGLLASVRERAEPYGRADAEADQRSHPEADRLERLSFEVELAANGGDEAALRRVQSQRAVVQARVTERRTWRFQQAQTQFLHDQVAALVARLDAFAGPRGVVERVRGDREFLTYARQRSLIEGGEAWARAAAAVAGEPRYRGLRLQPVLDLVPLGADPHSGLFEFVHLRSGTRGREVPSRRADGTLAPDDDMGIVLVLAPPGTFAMGAQAADPGATNYDRHAGRYEAPVQDVALDAFWIGKYEVTIAQWQRLGGGQPSPWQVGQVVNGIEITERHPVTNVDFVEATRVLAAAGLTLPTEAQWEYACRAGTSSPWWFGDAARAPGNANCAGVAGAGPDAAARAPFLLPIGSLGANPFGLHEVHGNAGEWCDSLMCDYHVRPARAGDGRRASFLFDEQRWVIRGGTYSRELDDARSADRWRHAERAARWADLGLRACRRLESRP